MPAVQLGLGCSVLPVLPVQGVRAVPVAVRAAPMSVRAMTARTVPMPSGVVAAGVSMSQTEHGLRQQSNRPDQQQCSVNHCFIISVTRASEKSCRPIDKVLTKGLFALCQGVFSVYRRRNKTVRRCCAVEMQRKRRDYGREERLGAGRRGGACGTGGAGPASGGAGTNPLGT